MKWSYSFFCFLVDKGRRQLKAVKPKKLTKIESQVVVGAACNNGTSALVTKDGELYMYGKDTTHCDLLTGLYRTLTVVQ